MDVRCDRRALAALAAGAVLAGAGCEEAPSTQGSAPRSGVRRGRPPRRTPSSSATTTTPTPTVPAGPEPSDGRPRRALLTIPAIGITELPVVPYRGWTDDAPGTLVQNRGVAASPFGPRGGVGPGGVGNYQITAHRLSSTQAFLDLPQLGSGAKVFIDAGRVRYVYEVVQTRRTSFRSPASLRAQRAPVPGRPAVEPTKAMITLSTCATPEDHAAGNYWADQFDNPEHRIDKIGVLVATRAVPRRSGT